MKRLTQVLEVDPISEFQTMLFIDTEIKSG